MSGKEKNTMRTTSEKRKAQDVIGEPYLSVGARHAARSVGKRLKAAMSASGFSTEHNRAEQISNRAGDLAIGGSHM